MIGWKCVFVQEAPCFDLLCGMRRAGELLLHGAGSKIRRMTEAIAFDAHRFVKRLAESGFTEKRAETLAEEHVALLNSNLAT